jgi:tRNA A37 N6-isopentenylltransferase MiaA
MGDHLDGLLTLDAAVAAAKAATMAYARRQRTWFRKEAGAWRADFAPEPGAVVRWWESGAAGPPTPPENHP